MATGERVKKIYCRVLALSPHFLKKIICNRFRKSHSFLFRVFMKKVNLTVYANFTIDFTCDFILSPSPFGLDFGTLDFGLGLDNKK